jgi:hypothetical protein
MMNRLEVEGFGKKQLMVSEESVEYASHYYRKNRTIGACNRLDLDALGF